MSINDVCTVEVPDCDYGYTNAGGFCYKINTESNPACNTFYQSEGDIAGNSTLGTYQTSIIDCMNKCNSLKECKSIKFNYTGTPSANGLCRLTAIGDTVDIVPVSDDLSSYTCADVYMKQGDANNPLCLNVVSKDTAKIINIDLGTAQQKPIMPKVETRYVGADCRQSIINTNLSTNDDSDQLLQDMGDFCEKNPKIDTCKSFCKNLNYSSYCSSKLPISGFITITVFF